MRKRSYKAVAVAYEKWLSMRRSNYLPLTAKKLAFLAKWWLVGGDHKWRLECIIMAGWRDKIRIRLQFDLIRFI